MISKNKDFVHAIFKVISPCFKHFNNSQNFIVVSFVSSFGRNYFTQIVCHQVLLAQVI